MTSSWIFKSEPNEYSIDSLAKKGTGTWDGVRNHQAKNFIATMKEGDIAYFYHSSCAQPGIYGKMKVSGVAYPDSSAVDRDSKYYDPKALGKDGNNRWLAVDVSFVAKYSHPLLLSDIRFLPLGPCPLTARGNRLSIIPLTSEQAHMIETELSRTNA
eukprot:gene4397-4819_t